MARAAFARLVPHSSVARRSRAANRAGAATKIAHGARTWSRRIGQRCACRGQLARFTRAGDAGRPSADARDDRVVPALGRGGLLVGAQGRRLVALESHARWWLGNRAQSRDRSGFRLALISSGCRIRGARWCVMRRVNELELRPAAIVIGCGDVGSAVAHALHRAGCAVVLVDHADPPWTRRGMAYADAWYVGAASLSGVGACFCASVRSIPFVLDRRDMIAATTWSWQGVAGALQP